MLLNNPQVQSYLQQEREPVTNAFRHAGLVTPTPQFHFSPGTSEYQIPSMLGDYTGRAIEGKHMLRPMGGYLASLNQNPGRAALMTALGLGGAGALYGLATGRSPILSGLVGAGIGAAGGYGLGSLIKGVRDNQDAQWQANMMKKYSFYLLNGQDPMSYIQQRLLEDNTMTADRRANLMVAVQNLPQDKLMHLADVLRASFGAGVGYIVGRFLLNMGGLGSGILAGLGGMAGLSLGGGNQLRNAIGLPVNPGSDLFGNPRLV